MVGPGSVRGTVIATTGKSPKACLPRLRWAGEGPRCLFQTPEPVNGTLFGERSFAAATGEDLEMERPFWVVGPISSGNAS